MTPTVLPSLLVLYCKRPRRKGRQAMVLEAGGFQDELPACPAPCASRRPERALRGSAQVRGASWAGAEGSGAAWEPVREPAGAGAPGGAWGVATRLATPAAKLREALASDGGTNGPLRSALRGRGSPRCRRSWALPPGPVAASPWAASSGASRRSPARPGEANLPGRRAGTGQRGAVSSLSPPPGLPSTRGASPTESRPHSACTKRPVDSGGQT